MNFKLTKLAESVNTARAVFFIGFSGNAAPVDLSEHETYNVAFNVFTQNLIAQGHGNAQSCSIYARNNLFAYHAYELLAEVECGALWPLNLGLVEKTGEVIDIQPRLNRANDEKVTFNFQKPLIAENKQMQTYKAASEAPVNQSYLCTAGFLAIGASNVFKENDNSHMAETEVIYRVCVYAPFLQNVAEWLLEKDAISCVFDYDVTEAFGQITARRIIREESVNAHAILCDIFEKLGNKNIDAEWKECPLIDFSRAKAAAKNADSPEPVSCDDRYCLVFDIDGQPSEWRVFDNLEEAKAEYKHYSSKEGLSSISLFGTVLKSTDYPVLNPCLDTIDNSPAKAAAK